MSTLAGRYQTPRSLYLSAGSDSIDANQMGSESFPGPDWLASHEDAFAHYGGGFRIAGLGEKIDLTLDYTRSDGETKIYSAGQKRSPAILCQTRIDNGLTATVAELQGQRRMDSTLEFAMSSSKRLTGHWTAYCRIPFRLC